MTVTGHAYPGDFMKRVEVEVNNPSSLRYYDEGYKAGRKRAFDLLEDLITWYKKEAAQDTGYVHSNHLNQGRLEAALYAQMVISSAHGWYQGPILTEVDDPVEPQVEDKAQLTTEPKAPPASPSSTTIIKPLT